MRWAKNSLSSVCRKDPNKRVWFQSAQFGDGQKIFALGELCDPNKTPCAVQK